MTATVLVVEDDPTMAEVLLAYLGRAGYRVEWSADGTEAAQVWQRLSPDVVILDIMLPGLSGLGAAAPPPPARRSRGDRRCCRPAARKRTGLVGLETGADDYVVKPFSPRELVLRVEALLRRAERLAGNPPLLNSTIAIGPVVVDSAAREAQLNGGPLSLTMREFDLLAFLAGHAGQTFGKEELLRRVWGWDFGDTSTVTVHVRRLREKLERDPSDPAGPDRGRAGYRLSRADELAVRTDDHDDLMVIIALTVASCPPSGAGSVSCIWSAAGRCAISSRSSRCCPCWRWPPPCWSTWG